MATRHLALPIFMMTLACAHARTQTDAPHAAESKTSVASSSVAIAADAPRYKADDLPDEEAPADAVRTASGLAYVVLQPGTGTEHPPAGARVLAHYVGWTASDLAMFDNSYDRGEPIQVQAEHVIKGWGEALQHMVVGQQIRVWIPEALAYEGKPHMPQGVLIFDIELVAIDASEELAPAPERFEQSKR